MKKSLLLAFGLELSSEFKEPEDQKELAEDTQVMWMLTTFWQILNKLGVSPRARRSKMMRLWLTLKKKTSEQPKKRRKIAKRKEPKRLNHGTHPEN